jgi:uncharacterized protein YukE
MRTWDLNAGAAKLELAMKALAGVNADVGERWSDEKNLAFQKEYIRPLDPKMRNLFDALNRLADVLATAARQCEDR